MSFYKEVPGRKTTLESTLKFDTTPTAGSTNPVTSDGVKGAIDSAVGDAAEALQEQINDIAEKAGSGYIPKGEASVATLNGLSGQENGELYTMTDAGTLTDGSLAVVAGDTVAWDATNEVWYKAMDYAPRQYGTNEVHNLSTTITAFRTGDVIPVDGPDGSAKMSKDNLLREAANNVRSVAQQFDTTTNYSVNSMVLYYGWLYRFVKNHSAGPWNYTEVEMETLENLVRRIEVSFGNVFSPYDNYSKGDFVVYRSRLYKFKVDHSAGDWDADDVVTVKLCDEFADKGFVYSLHKEFSEGTKYVELFDTKSSDYLIGKGYSGSTGSIVDSAVSTISPYIFVSAGRKCRMFSEFRDVFKSSNMYYKIAYYDNQKKWLKTQIVNNEALSSDGWYDFQHNGFVRMQVSFTSLDYYLTNSFVCENKLNLSNISIDDGKIFDVMLSSSKANLLHCDDANFLNDKGFSGNTNVIVDSPSSSITGYIPVTTNDLFKIIAGGVNVHTSETNFGIKVAVYDSDKTWIKTVEIYSTSDLYWKTESIKPNWNGYIRVHYRHAYQVEIFFDDVKSILPDYTKVDDGRVVDVILFAGQSNMAGRGVSNSLHPETAPTSEIGSGWEYKAISKPGVLSPLKEPFGVYENNPNGINEPNMKTGSMVVSFVNNYYKQAKIPVIAVSASKGGSSIDEWQSGQSYYTDATTRLNDCKTWLSNNGYKIRHTLLCWCQGEHEWNVPETYAPKFISFFNAIKNDCGVEYCLFVRVGLSAGEQDFSAIVQAQTNLCKTEKDVVLVSADFASMKDRGLMKDDYHYYQQAYNEVGQDAGINSASFINSLREPTMYDPMNDNLYYSKKISGD